MRLESDPTVIYGIPGFDGNLRRRDLEDEGNPYNTYRIAALPPGPIASPGEASLRAVVTPAPSKYLYFVARNDGTHAFSSTLREHARAVERYQKKARDEARPSRRAPALLLRDDPAPVQRQRSMRRSGSARAAASSTRRCATSTPRSASRCAARAADASISTSGHGRMSAGDAPAPAALPHRRAGPRRLRPAGRARRATRRSPCSAASRAWPARCGSRASGSRASRQLQGAVRFAVRGEGGFDLITHFGPGPVPEQPTASIAVDEAAYRELRERRARPGRRLHEREDQGRGRPAARDAARAGGASPD